MNNRGPERNEGILHAGAKKTVKGKVLTAMAVGMMAAAPVQGLNLNNSTNQGSRDNVAVVSSSNLGSRRERASFPFPAAVAEKVGNDTAAKARVVIGSFVDGGSKIKKSVGHRIGKPLGGAAKENSRIRSRGNAGDESMFLESDLSLAEDVRSRLDGTQNLHALDDKRLSAVIRDAVEHILISVHSSRANKFILPEMDVEPTVVGDSSKALVEFERGKREVEICRMINRELHAVFERKAKAVNKDRRTNRKFLERMEMVASNAEARKILEGERFEDAGLFDENEDAMFSEILEANAEKQEADDFAYSSWAKGIADRKVAVSGGSAERVKLGLVDPWENDDIVSYDESGFNPVTLGRLRGPVKNQHPQAEA